MAKVAWTAGIEYVSGALCKCGQKGQHTHAKMLLATHRRAATTNPDCNRLYLRNELNIQKSFSTDAVWARQRFQSVAAMVRQRSRDLLKISQDQMNFIAQRNNPYGKKTMKSYYWYICGQEWDAQHPQG
ncbi:MAG: hypothetical protein II901_00025 [Paludibacteraceae bacterium]|nr:hypothetical protein [Paludibacteraceae bacterium]